MEPQAACVEVADRRVMDVDLRLNDSEPENSPVERQKDVRPLEVDGPSSPCDDPWDDEIDMPDVLSQSKFELLNERHCLNGDGAEKLMVDFCGERVLSLDRNASKLSEPEWTPSSSRTSRLRSSMLSVNKQERKG